MMKMQTGFVLIIDSIHFRFLMEMIIHVLKKIESIDIPMNLTVDRLLFGSPDLTDDQNNSLFLNVQKFIINSKRFI